LAGEGPGRSGWGAGKKKRLARGGTMTLPKKAVILAMGDEGGTGSGILAKLDRKFQPGGGGPVRSFTALGISFFFMGAGPLPGPETYYERPPKKGGKQDPRARAATLEGRGALF